jgi:hypothetical protein
MATGGQLWRTYASFGSYGHREITMSLKVFMVRHMAKDAEKSPDKSADRDDE